MSKGDAWRKILSAKLVNEQPELESKLEEGSLTQTQKADVLKEIENTSTEKAKIILLSKSTAPERHLKEKVKQKTSTLTEVTLYLDDETMQALTRLKEVWSNAIPSCELGKIAKRAIQEALDKHDPIKKDDRSQQKSPAPGRKLKPNTKSESAMATNACSLMNEQISGATRNTF